MCCNIVRLNLIILCWTYTYSSSPESLGIDRSDSKSPSPMVSPTVFYKLIVPILK